MDLGFTWVCSALFPGRGVHIVSVRTRRIPTHQLRVFRRISGLLYVCAWFVDFAEKDERCRSTNQSEYEKLANFGQVLGLVHAL